MRHPRWFVFALVVDAETSVGMTETAPASFMTEVSDTPERKLETVGRVLPHVKAKIVDVDNKIVPRGVPGEVCVSGWLLQSGYFRNPEKTDEVMIHDEHGTRWMYTGDEGVIDEDGYLRITGRIKDIIIRGTLHAPRFERPRVPYFFDIFKSGMLTNNV